MASDVSVGPYTPVFHNAYRQRAIVDVYAVPEVG